MYGQHLLCRLPELVLSLDKSIRYSAVVNKLGYIVAQRYRPGLQPVLTPEETHKYALQATIRQSTRSGWDKKLGKSLYSFTRYERLVRMAIPLADGRLLLLSCDIETRNVDTLVMDKIIPAVTSYHLQG